MFVLTSSIVMGIDLAGKPENPTGLAVLKKMVVKTSLIHTDEELLKRITCHNPEVIAIDAPFNFPKTGTLRRAEKEMINKGYRVLPPTLPAMKKLTFRAIKLNALIAEEGYKTIEVHPTSTRKALGIPIKDWNGIQTILRNMGLQGDLETRALAPHEIDALTAALTARLYLRDQTELLGDEEGGYIVVPKKLDWRGIKIWAKQRNCKKQ